MLDEEAAQPTFDRLSDFELVGIFLESDRDDPGYDRIVDEMARRRNSL
jgi:hypothetical protein